MAAPGRLTIAVDLDAVLAKFEGWTCLEEIGEPIQGAVEFTRRLQAKHDILIWTTRCNAELGQSGRNGEAIVRAWLEKHKFHYTSIFVGSAKPIAAGFIDDRAICCRPQEDPDWYEHALERVDFLTEEVPPGCSLRHDQTGPVAP